MSAIATSSQKTTFHGTFPSLLVIKFFLPPLLQYYLNLRGGLIKDVPFRAKHLWLFVLSSFDQLEVFIN